MGRREKRRIESLLTRLFEHLLKLTYWRLRSSTRRVSTPRRRYAERYPLGQAFTRSDLLLGKGTREVKRKERNYNQNHWKREIRNFRKQIKKELKASPSLKNYLLKVFEECYQDSRELVADVSELPLNTFPSSPIGNVEQILNENWLP